MVGVCTRQEWNVNFVKMAIERSESNFWKNEASEMEHVRCTDNFYQRWHQRQRLEMTQCCRRQQRDFS